MSKIQLMGSGAFDVFCPTKRVYFRPATSSDTIVVGDLVCYNSDSVQDHKERTADPKHLGLTIDTYAEGAQDFTGRLFIVEKPADTNLHQIAGIVKSLGDKAGADGDMIEIWVLTDGAVVPVRTDLDVTQGETVLAVKVGSYVATDPIYGGSTTSLRIIGLAEETKDRSTDSGLVWMRMSTSGIFGVTGGYGGVTANRVLLGPAATSGDMYGHFMSVRTTATGGSLTAFRLRAELNGAGSNAIALRAEAVIGAGSTAQDGDSVAITAHLIFKQGAIASANKLFHGLECKIENQDSTPADLSASGTIYVPLKLVTQIKSATPPPANSHYMMYMRADGADKPDGLFIVDQASSINAVATAQTGDGVGSIPIRIGGITYYLKYWSAAS